MSNKAYAQYTISDIYDGEDGVGILSIEEQYYKSTSNNPNQQFTPSQWSTTSPTWENGKYIWTRSKITWDNDVNDPNHVTYTTPVLSTTYQSLYTDVTNKISNIATQDNQGNWSLTNGVIENTYVYTDPNHTNAVAIGELGATITTTKDQILSTVSNTYATQTSLTTEVNKRKATYVTSSTASGTRAKVGTCNNFELYNGATITCVFSNANTTSAPTLNVNSTGAKEIKSYTGATLTEDEYKWSAGSAFTLVYDGANWRMQDSGTVLRVSTAESNIQQNSDSISAMVSVNGQSSSITLTQNMLEAITNQFIVKSPDGTRTVISGGLLSTDAVQSNNYSVPSNEGSVTSPYSISGTMLDLSNGNIISPSFAINGSNGDAFFKGTINALAGKFGSDTDYYEITDNGLVGNKIHYFHQLSPIAYNTHISSYDYSTLKIVNYKILVRYGNGNEKIFVIINNGEDSLESLQGTNKTYIVENNHTIYFGIESTKSDLSDIFVPSGGTVVKVGYTYTVYNPSFGGDITITTGESEDNPWIDFSYVLTSSIHATGTEVGYDYIKTHNLIADGGTLGDFIIDKNSIHNKMESFDDEILIPHKEGDVLIVSDMEGDYLVNDYELGANDYLEGTFEVDDFSGIYIGTDGIALGKGAFKVDKYGNMEINCYGSGISFYKPGTDIPVVSINSDGGVFTGTINANAGVFGTNSKYFTIGKDGLIGNKISEYYFIIADDIATVQPYSKYIFDSIEIRYASSRSVTYTSQNIINLNHVKSLDLIEKDNGKLAIHLYIDDEISINDIFGNYQSITYYCIRFYKSYEDALSYDNFEYITNSVQPNSNKYPFNTITETGTELGYNYLKTDSLIASDGLLITDNEGKMLAKYGDAITIGNDDGNQTYAKFDYHSMQIIPKGKTTPYFYISDLRGQDGLATVTDYFIIRGGSFSLPYIHYPILDFDSEVSVVLSDVDVTGDSSIYTIEQNPDYYNKYYFNFPNLNLQANYSLKITYKTSDFASAFTFGSRQENSVIGINSIAIGERCTASGYNSFAQGYYNFAEGMYSVATGTGSKAIGHNSFAHGNSCETRGNGSFAVGAICSTTTDATFAIAMGDQCVAEKTNSVALGYDTVSNTPLQTVIGGCNIRDTNNKYAFIIGNGAKPYDSYSYIVGARSNAFTVDWNGMTRANGFGSLDESYLEIIVGNMTNRAKQINSSLTTSSGDQAWLTAILKAICADYPGKAQVIFKGRFQPNSLRFFQIMIYDTSALSGGMPRYSYGWCMGYGRSFSLFGTEEYAYQARAL